jgi:hypothetical protein
MSTPACFLVHQLSLSPCHKKVLIKSHDVTLQGLGHWHLSRSTVERFDLVLCKYMIYLLQLDETATSYANSKVFNHSITHICCVSNIAGTCNGHVCTTTKEVNNRYLSLIRLYLYRFRWILSCTCHRNHMSQKSHSLSRTNLTKARKRNNKC